MSYIDFSGLYDFFDEVRKVIHEDGGAWMFAFSHKDLRDEVVRLNQEQLYEYGIKSDGTFVLPDYSPFTIEIKRKKGQRYDHVTLKDTGKFYASFRVVYGKDWFEVLADDESGYDTPLFEIYGDEVMGLTEYNLERIRVLILRYYAEYYARRLFY